MGIPRAGNTFLSSIMNQNPEVSMTGNSMVSEIMYRINEIKYMGSTYNLFKDEKSLNNVTRSVFDNYYKDWKCKYVIDRSSWGNNYNLQMLKDTFGDDIKMIVLVRDLKQVMASFLKWSYLTKNNFIAEYVKDDDTLEKRFDGVYYGTLHRWIDAVRNLLLPENKKYIHIIEYDDLVNNIEKEIDGIYDYLNINPFQHRFTNLTQLDHNGVKYNDKELGEGLHTIQTKSVKKREYDYTQYIPDDISKYDLEPFWR